MDAPQKPERPTNWRIEIPVGLIFSLVSGLVIMRLMPLPLGTALKAVVITGVLITMYRLARKQSGILVWRGIITTIGFAGGVWLSALLF